MMEEQQVREAIDGLIEQQERRMATYQGDSIIPDAGAISEIGHSIDALIHLKHVLRLCGCPPEAYEKAGEKHENNAVEYDDSTTVSGLPAPAGWTCIERKRDENGIYGRFWVRTTGEAIRVIESVYTRPDDSRTWLHVSVSKPTRKMPTWDDIQTMRRCFVGEKRESYMVFPTQERYVNIHPGVLHLYCCLDQPQGVLPHFEGELAIGGEKRLSI